MSRIAILIPTHDHGPLLGCAIDSALRQTVQDFEIIVIGDGVPADARPHVEAACKRDARIRYVERPKSARTGEPYRHEVLQKLDCELVFYLSDDDLWLPDHLELMSRALQGADFANTWSVRVGEGKEGMEALPFAGLRRQEHRWLLYNKKNRIGLSAVAHRLDAYRRLPFGWRQTPPELGTDAYMWMQWVEAAGTRFASLQQLTLLNFRSPPRKDWSLARREEELRRWLVASATPAGCLAIQKQAMAQLLKLSSVLESDWLHLKGLIPKQP
jgi:GalNAc5-diNAcBac-PP-undecaprenol beta-1,3-glucosyltransferase